MNQDVRLAQYAIFYVAVLLFLCVGAITTFGLGWYGSVSIPGWMPGQLLTAIIWLVLFLATALSMSVFWKNTVGTDRVNMITFLYMGNAALVLLWNYLFFGVHRLTEAFIAALLVGISLVVLTAVVWRVSRTSAWLLGPYLIWMVVAIVFSYQIMLLN